MSEIHLPPSPFIRKSLEDVRLPLGTMALDAGCHTGRNMNALISHGYKAIGIDSDMTAMIQHPMRNQHPSVAFVQCDLRNLPFADNSFKLVLNNEVLQDVEVDERALIINGIQRVTDQDGVHMVSGYIGERDRALDSGELEDLYRTAGWHILSYSEDKEQHHGDGLSSLAKIIALKS